tara:strand:+ start:30 stop:224 length:195 start_codon:yes stop_codon:yes gene_type:complete
MSRSPLWYILGIGFLLSGLIPTYKDFFNTGIFLESPVVLFMAIFFLPFMIALGLLTKRRFTNVL